MATNKLLTAAAIAALSTTSVVCQRSFARLQLVGLYRRGLSVVRVFGLGYLIPALQTYPDDLTLTTDTFWSNSVKYLNINFFDAFEAVKIFFLSGFLLPIKRFFLGVPWPWAIFVLILVGYRFGGWKLGLVNGLVAVFIVSTGMWEKAMITVYLCGASVIIASVIGIPLGNLAAVNARAARIRYGLEAANGH